MKKLVYPLLLLVALSIVPFVGNSQYPYPNPPYLASLGPCYDGEAYGVSCANPSSTGNCNADGKYFCFTQEF